MRLARLAAILLLPLLAGCTAAPAWRATSEPTREEAEAILADEDTSSLVRRSLPRDVPTIPARKRLRPCCAFGSEIQAKLGPLPVPGYRIGNVLGPDELGAHKYDSGMLVWEPEGRGEVQWNREINGLVYTCRGGFIDTAHVRDYVDWGIWTSSRIGLLSGVGGTIEMPTEGGTRRIHVAPAPQDLVDRYGLRRLVIEAAIWLTFQLSVWHEIATWFGYASVPGFSERASAFSPEDLYSNIFGAKLVAGIVYRRDARSENVFNRAVDAWIDHAMDVLGPVPRELGTEMAQAVDGLWWDSSRRVPDPRLVLRRHMDADSPILPWQVPDARLGDDQRARLDAACPGGREPLPLPFVSSFAGRRFADYVTLEIEVDGAIAAQAPFTHMGRTITQEDFPAIIEVIRTQNAAEFGEGSDRPE